MKKPAHPPEIAERAKGVTSKRARTVIQHILGHGYITTEELTTLYGYQHPPRAARDVREQGIPLETFRVKNAEGRSIAAYRFPEDSAFDDGKLGGRRAFPKRLKRALIDMLGSRCSVCLVSYEPRYLQVDHRVPYEVAGDRAATAAVLAGHMLVCGSCNRAKSWSCEHCANWSRARLAEVCESCYWASPDSYMHVALRLVRRADLVWTDQEVQVYDKIKVLAQSSREPLPEFMKQLLARCVRQRPSRVSGRKGQDAQQ